MRIREKHTIITILPMHGGGTELYMKKLLSFFAALSVSAVLSSPLVFADTEKNAKTLYDLGLLKGTGTTFSVESLSLDRNATRAEICTTIVRMLGKEEKAHYQQNPHPFNDVPSWAGDYVGWLYENYLVNGVSAAYFGAQDIATVRQFSTMLLRVLGYDDTQGDFSYDGAVNFAQSLGLLDSETASHWELSRSDMINMSYNAMRMNIKNSARTLARKLCDEGAVDEALAKSSGILSAPSLSDSFPGVPENLGSITAIRNGNSINIHLTDMAEHYGIRIFMREGENGVMQEIKSSGSIYFQKGKISYPGGSAAGYISDLYIYGLDTGKKYSFIVVKTSSESELYLTTGKSKTTEL